MKKFDKKKIIFMVMNFIFAFCFTLLFSHSTSPIYQTMGSDQAMFLLIGKGITEGYVPYRDLMENKGPLFFLIQALPQFLLEGVFGVYLLQSFMLWIELELLDSISKLFSFSSVKRTLLKIIFGCALLLVYSSGNMAEEYDLFFSMIALNLFVHCIKSKILTGKKFWLSVFGLGLLAGAVIWIKINDVFAILAMCLDVFLLKCVETRKVKECVWFLLRCLGIFCGGLLVATIVTLFYYWKNHAIGDMIFGYFTLNFSMVYEGGRYQALMDRMELLRGWYGLFAMLPLIIVLICYIKDRTMDGLLYILVSMATIATAFVHGTGFQQHLILCTISWGIAGLSFLRTIWTANGIENLGYFFVSIYLFSCFAFQLTEGGELINKYPIWKQEDYEDPLQACIPKDEWDDVYCFGKGSKWYYVNDVYPPYKYLNLGNFLRHMGSIVANDFECHFEEKPTKWIIIPYGIESYGDLFSVEFSDYILEEYERYDSFNEYVVYKKIV